MTPAGAVVALAIAASITYGIADFLGGIAVRRAPLLAVLVIGQGTSLVALGLLLQLLPATTHAPGDVPWGVAAGIAGVAAIALFYTALASGRMSLVAPVSAVCGLALPVIVGLALGERPSSAAMAGVGLAALAVVILGRAGDPGTHPSAPAAPPRASTRRSLAIAIAAGLVIGIFYVCLAQTSPGAGLTPLAVGRIASLAMLGLVLTVRRQDPRRVLRVSRGSLSVILGAAFLDTAANAFYLLAVRGGLMSVVAPLASLYPASTVLLARIVLRERLGGVHLAGLAVAGLAIVLMTIT